VPNELRKWLATANDERKYQNSWTGEKRLKRTGGGTFLLAHQPKERKMNQGADWSVVCQTHKTQKRLIAQQMLTTG